MFESVIASHFTTPERPLGLGVPLKSFGAFSRFPEFKVLFTTIVNYLFIFAFLVAFGYLLYGGFRLITSGGSERAVAEARETITYAIIGLAVVFVAFLFVKLVEGITKVTIF